MPAKPGKRGPVIAPEISPEMKEYIRESFSELRISTTCEGPILLPLRISPPKPMDHKFEVEGRTLYISAVQAPRIKRIDSSMPPLCALQTRGKC